LVYARSNKDIAENNSAGVVRVSWFMILCFCKILFFKYKKKPGGLEAWKLGSWEARKLGSGEAGKLGNLETKKLGSSGSQERKEQLAKGSWQKVLIK